MAPLEDCCTQYSISDLFIITIQQAENYSKSKFQILTLHNRKHSLECQNTALGEFLFLLVSHVFYEQFIVLQVLEARMWGMWKCVL